MISASKNEIKIALRKSDNPTDIIPPNQHRCALTPTFGTCPFHIGNGLRDLIHRATFGKMLLYRYAYDST